MKTRPDPLSDPRFQELISRLRGQEAAEPSPGFTARTMEHLHRRPARPLAFSSILVRAAAALALLCGAGIWLVRGPGPVAKSPAPIDILMAAQRSDGGWSADAQGPRSRYDTSVTALALLALMHAEPSPLEGSQAAAFRAGMAHLLRQQRPDGRFGEDFSGSAFTQYLAGMAVQAAARLPGTDPAWRLAARRAEPHVPSGCQMAKLNGTLAHPDAFPSRWADAGGPVARTAIQMLAR